MANAALGKNFLEVSQHKYFRALAENIQLGQFGRKRIHPLVANYLDVHGNIKLPLQDAIEQPTVIKFDFLKSKKAHFGINVPYKAIESNLGFDYETAKSGKLVLVKLVLNKSVLFEQLNHNPEVVAQLQNLKPARFVNQLFVITEATFADVFTHQANFSVDLLQGKQAIKAAVGHGGEGQTTLMISEGTVFAYGLVRPVLEKGTGKVIRLDNDQPGIG
jgi:hypothetical protein